MRVYQKPTIYVITHPEYRKIKLDGTLPELIQYAQELNLPHELFVRVGKVYLKDNIEIGVDKKDFEEIIRVFLVKYKKLINREELSRLIGITHRKMFAFTNEYFGLDTHILLKLVDVLQPVSESILTLKVDLRLN